MIFDADQHLYEQADTYERYVDPSKRGYALRLEPDHLGYWWAVMPWQGGVRCNYAWIGTPGDFDPIATHIKVDRANGVPSKVDYVRDLPPAYCDPAARIAQLDAFGIDKTILLPQLGLLWLQKGGRNLTAVRANFEAWNRYVVDVQHEGRGRLYPVGQITLRGGDQGWAVDQLTRLAAGGVKACVVPHTLADGRRLSHEDHERTWSAFEDLGVVPVMHVIEGEERPSGLAHEWFENDGDHIIPMLETPFTWTGIHLGLADMILNGTFERHPRLRVAAIELGGLWYPQLLGLDMMWSTASGLPPLPKPPSEYVREQIVLSPGPQLPSRPPVRAVRRGAVHVRVGLDPLRGARRPAPRLPGDRG